MGDTIPIPEPSTMGFDLSHKDIKAYWWTSYYNDVDWTNREGAGCYDEPIKVVSYDESWSIYNTTNPRPTTSLTM